MGNGGRRGVESAICIFIQYLAKVSKSRYRSREDSPTLRSPGTVPQEAHRLLRSGRGQPGGVKRRNDPGCTVYFFTVTPTVPTAVPPFPSLMV